MRVFLVAIAALGCKQAAPPPPPEPVGERIAPSPPVIKGAAPLNRLRTDEGSLSIGRIDGAVGAEGTASITVTPGPGFHISRDVKSMLTLTAPEGVALAQTELVAGKGKLGDARELTENSLAFAVRATPERVGTFEITGTLAFAVCRDDGCRPRTEAVTIAVAAR